MGAGGPAGPVRVLLLTAACERGGAEVTMEHIVKRLDTTRYAGILAAPAGSALLSGWQAAGWDAVATPPVHRLRHVRETIRVIGAIASTIRTRGIGLVHTHGIGAHIHGGLAARRSGRAVIAHVQDMFDPRWSRNGVLHRLALAVPREVTVVPSAAVASSLAHRVPADRLELIPNGVESDLVAPVTRADRTPLVVWCGRLQRWKGAHLFLDAARRILDARPDVRFAVVGGTMFGMEPEYSQELQARARTLGLSSSVEFTGQVPDARAWLAAATVVVHSSVTPDPFPHVVLEAMMQSRPVVAFRMGGPAEAIVDGETGRLVPPGDTDALARAVLDLLNDPGRLEAMSHAARRVALQRYDEGLMVRRVEAVYDRVRNLQGAARGTPS